jgi:hypothetical protein
VTDTRGSNETRRRRREWLIETYRANADLFLLFGAPVETCVGMGEPACRCYRCGQLLTVETVTADRIVPGIHGGTYRRSNIRPACMHCNSSTGARLRRKKR